MAKYKVFIAEDNISVIEDIQSNLSKDDYEIITEVDGSRVAEVAGIARPDLIVLASRFKGFSGFDICRSLRKDTTVPILMLGSSDEEIDKVVGLELGADDYVSKPFGKREIIARIRAMLRRKDMITWEDKKSIVHDIGLPAPIQVDDITIDLSLHKVSHNGTIIDLSPMEFKLLSFLARNRGQVFSRDQLLNQVWSYDYEGGRRTVDVRIRALRQKIEDDPANPKNILTVRGIGYQFRS